MLCTEIHRLHHVFILSAIAHIKSDIYIIFLPKIISDSLSFTPTFTCLRTGHHCFPGYAKISFSLPESVSRHKERPHISFLLIVIASLVSFY